jgi:hypothetical protein
LITGTLAAREADKGASRLLATMAGLPITRCLRFISTLPLLNLWTKRKTRLPSGVDGWGDGFSADFFHG